MTIQKPLHPGEIINEIFIKFLFNFVLLIKVRLESNGRFRELALRS